MTERSIDPRAVDVMAFCRNGGSLRAQWPLARMPRLAASLAAVPVAAAASWAAHGSLVPLAAGESEVWLHLEGHAAVDLQCQRCLQAMTEHLSVDRRFRFVRSEAEAARLDEESEDDVLVLQPRLDLHELLEDELILNLPLVPRHGVCPQPLPQPVAGADEAQVAPHPFAVLAALRGRPPRGDA